MTAKLLFSYSEKQNNSETITGQKFRLTPGSSQSNSEKREQTLACCLSGFIERSAALVFISCIVVIMTFFVMLLGVFVSEWWPHEDVVVADSVLFLWKCLEAILVFQQVARIDSCKFVRSRCRFFAVWLSEKKFLSPYSWTLKVRIA